MEPYREIGLLLPQVPSSLATAAPLSSVFQLQNCRGTVTALSPQSCSYGLDTDATGPKTQDSLLLPQAQESGERGHTPASQPADSVPHRPGMPSQAFSEGVGQMSQDSGLDLAPTSPPTHPFWPPWLVRPDSGSWWKGDGTEAKAWGARHGSGPKGPCQSPTPCLSLPLSIQFLTAVTHSRGPKGAKAPAESRGMAAQRNKRFQIKNQWAKKRGGAGEREAE